MPKEEKRTRESRGERLKKIRKSKGLSLEQVHQGTKIHMGIIKDLEEDVLGGMAPAYIKGLLKIYCTFLGVDAKEFIEDYDRPESNNKIEAADSSASAEQLPLTKPKVNLSVIKKKINIKPIVLIVFLLVLGIAAFKFGKNISTTTPKPNPEVVPAVSQPAPVVNRPRLGVRAKEDCWLEVKCDGKTIFKGILKKGRSDFWEAEEKIEFTVGSAGVIEIEVNRRMLPTLGRRGQVIRNILVTKEGLIAPQ